MAQQYDKALEVALKAHEGQFDKNGEIYILHPLRVAGYFTDDRKKAVAILHDVVEDSPMTLEEVREAVGLDDEQVRALDCLTRRKDEDRGVYMSRVLSSSMAIQIKMMDLKDNMDVSRMKQELSQKDIDRLNRYIKEFAYLKKNMA